MGDPGTLIALSHASGLLNVDGFARLIAVGERKTFASGELLMKQADVADCLYVLLAGRVSVSREHPDLSAPIILASLGPGEVVGEMGLLDGEPRSATVTAVEETIAVQVSSELLQQTIRKSPDLYVSLVKLLSKRLRDTNELAAWIASGKPAPVESAPSD